MSVCVCMSVCMSMCEYKCVSYDFVRKVSPSIRIRKKSSDISITFRLTSSIELKVIRFISMLKVSNI